MQIGGGQRLAQKPLQNGQNDEGGSKGDWQPGVDFKADLHYESFRLKDNEPTVVAASAAVKSAGFEPNLAVTSGGTIPARGLFGVFLPDGTRVGELDEEMVYESRP